MANEIIIPLTQMFIECVQEWDETDENKTGWSGSGWFYLANEDFDFEKYYNFYVVVDQDKHYNAIKSIWELKSEYHNDLLKVPENRIFFNVLSEQEKSRLKYKQSLIKAQPELNGDIFLPFEDENPVELKENYTKEKFNKFCRQQELLNKILNTAKYLANLEMEDFIILTPKQANDPEIIKEAKRILNIKD